MINSRNYLNNIGYLIILFIGTDYAFVVIETLNAAECRPD
ncbi:hypothetical protein GHAL_1478 [Hafnia alvei ATCC 13337]|uniref:Uncharacterized protein n=1 Tax=Hafnia alvei ATCC 13337 TaxID=910996 RepID=A0ABD3ZIR5_HAFAL|nr:hypothetical protein GHAL_1478 [Hafnia alvei ATCC 13337]